jgi:hypothetical protein
VVVARELVDLKGRFPVKMKTRPLDQLAEVPNGFNALLR